MNMDGLTLYPAIRRNDGLVHKLQGGGVGMRDEQGKPLYDPRLIWCRDEEIEDGGEPTDAHITCPECVQEYARQQREWEQDDIA